MTCVSRSASGLPVRRGVGPRRPALAARGDAGRANHGEMLPESGAVGLIVVQGREEKSPHGRVCSMVVECTVGSFHQALEKADGLLEVVPFQEVRGRGRSGDHWS